MITTNIPLALSARAVCRHFLKHDSFYIFPFTSLMFQFDSSILILPFFFSSLFLIFWYIHCHLVLIVFVVMKSIPEAFHSSRIMQGCSIISGNPVRSIERLDNLHYHVLPLRSGTKVKAQEPISVIITASSLCLVSDVRMLLFPPSPFLSPAPLQPLLPLTHPPPPPFPSLPPPPIILPLLIFPSFPVLPNGCWRVLLQRRSLQLSFYGSRNQLIVETCYLHSPRAFSARLRDSAMERLSRMTPGLHLNSLGFGLSGFYTSKEINKNSFIQVILINKHKSIKSMFIHAYQHTHAHHTHKYLDICMHVYTNKDNKIYSSIAYVSY